MKVRGYPNLMGSWGVRKNKKLLKNSVKVFSSFKKVLHEKKIKIFLDTEGKKKFQNIFGYGGVHESSGYPNLMGSWVG
jgi:flavoprotein